MILASHDRLNGGRKLIKRKTYRYRKNKPLGEQYIGDSTDLSIISSETYDCLLASHVLEHIANPIKAIKEWMRVLKDRGQMLLVLPHKEGTFDHLRPITTLDHLIHDFNGNTAENDEAHFDEILEFTDYSWGKKPHSLEQMKKSMKVNGSARGMHQHVFNTKLVLELCNYINLKIIGIYHLLPFHIIVLCRKLHESFSVNNKSCLSDNAIWKNKSPFTTDREA